jgi:hypothetical protein
MIGISERTSPRPTDPSRAQTELMRPRQPQRNAGGRAIKQTQQVQRGRSTPQQTFALECAPEPEHC